MELYVIGKFIGIEVDISKQYLRFAVKNWLLEMWVEELRIYKEENNDNNLKAGCFYLITAIPAAYRLQCVYARSLSVSGPF